MIANRTRRNVMFGLAAAAAIPPTAAFAEDTVQSIYEAAKKEGKVTFLSSNDVKPNQESAKRFAQKFPGIAVEAFKIEPGPAIERIIGEAASGRLTVDVVDSPISYTPLLLNRGLVVSYPFDRVFGIPKDDLLFDSRAIHSYDLDVPICFNTTMAKASDLAGGWESLADPKWRGKILLEARGIVFPLLALAWGEERTFSLLQKILDNKPIIIKGGTPTIEALAGGQGAVAVGTYGGRVLQYQKDGAPVDWARVGPIPAMIYSQMVVKNAPHPNAALLWAFWTSTKDHLEELFKHHYFGRLRGPNISPLGKEMEAAGAQIVFESTDADAMQRLLAKSGSMIGGLK
jgi:iron(III) transport system substrate-binding protein